MNNYFKTALVMLSCAVILFGQYFLYIKKLPLSGIIMVFTGAFVIFLLLRRHLAGFSFSSKEPAAKKEIVMFLFILITAVFFRFYNLNEIPAGAHRDEAKACMDAVNIMNEKAPMNAGSKLPVYITGLTDNPAVFNYMISAFYKVTSPGIFNARIVSASLGVLAVIGMYFLLRLLFGVNTAFAVSLLFAVMKWHVVFSRTVYHAGFSVLLLILTLYYAYRVYINRKTGDFLIFAAVFSVSLYTFQAARAIPFAFAGCLFFLIFKDREFITKNIFKIGVSLLLAFALLTPLLDYAEKNRRTFFSRAAVHSVFHEATVNRYAAAGKNRMDIYAENAKKNLLMFNVWGDIHFPYNINSSPMLGFVAGGAALAGFFIAVFMLFYFNTFAWFLVILFGVFIHGGIMFANAPHSTRTIMTMPLTMIFAGLFVYSVFRIFSGSGKNVRRIIGILGIILLGAAITGNYKIYFKEYADTPYHWRGFAADSRMAGELVLEKGENKKGLIDSKYLTGHESHAFWLEFSGSERNVERFSQEVHIPFGDIPSGGFYYILSGIYEPFIPVLEKLYPYGITIRVYDRNRPHILSHFYFEVPAGRGAANTETIYKGLKTEVFSRGNSEKLAEYYDMTPVFFWHKMPEPGPLIIKWSGKLKTPVSGRYTFVTFSNPVVELYVGGRKLIDLYRERGRYYAHVFLDKGLHDFETLYYPARGRPGIDILWQTPAKEVHTIIPPDNFVKINEVRQ